MRKSLLLISFLLIHSMVFSQENYSPETLEKIKEIENNINGRLILNYEKPNTIAERMAKYHVKGMSIAVIYDYKIAWAKGYGWADESEKRPVTTKTLFEPGSISKSLNALGILKLAQDGKLDLYTDINTYLTSWKFPYDSLSKGKKITLADILSHTAGLTVHGFPGHDLNGPVPTVTDVLDGKAPAFTPAVRSMYEPGLKFEYSGGGITISQVLLTDVTRHPYDKWMYENILQPIGMINSSYSQPPSKDKWSICASAYRADGTPVKGKFHVYPEQAAAGLWMTPSDLSQYVIDMQLAYKGGKSKVLNDEMVKLHLTPYHNDITTMGSFILDRDGAKYFEHGAGNDGFCGDFYGSLEGGYGVVIFLNSEDGKLIPDVINAVAKAYNWKNFYKEPRRRTSITVDENILKTYAGIYLYDDTWAGIEKQNNEYSFFSNGQYAKMYFTQPDIFFNEEFLADKEFTKDEKGNVTGYKRYVPEKEFPQAVKIINPDTLNLSDNIFGEIGWYLLESKNYSESVSYFKRGVQLYPEDLNMQVNLAHAYLFNNDYKNAITIYASHLQEPDKKADWENLIRNDFAYFKDKHNDPAMFNKVISELKIKKPEGF